jgi:sulfate permease, SulP family
VFFFKLPVETIGTRFGGIPSGLPHLAIPKFRADLIHGLLGPAVTVAMLGAIESLMSAVVSDRMSNDRHNPNVELIGQGVANMVSPILGDCRRPALLPAPRPASAPANSLQRQE